MSEGLQARYDRVASQLADAERIARVGVWEWNVVSGDVSWSDEIYRLFGHQPGEFEPSFERWLEAIHPDDRERVQRHVQKAVEDPQPYEFEHRVVRPDGTTIHLHCRGDVATNDAGEPTRVVGASQDITQRVSQQETLDRLSRQREAILDAAGEGICGVDPEGRISFANPAAARILGLSIGELGGRALSDFVGGPFGNSDPLLESLRDGAMVEDQGATFRRADGTEFPADFICNPVLADGGDDVTGAVVTFSDATERRRFEDQLAFLADHDALTGLFNRRRFEQELALQVAYGERYSADLAVLIIDLDAFKDVNDTRGHRVGDELIASVGQRIARRLREGDVVCRFGGDEFAVLLPATSAEDAAIAAQSLREAIGEEPHLAGGRPIRVTASIGIAAAGVDASSAEELLSNADLAMYDAKDAGRDRVYVYAPAHRGRERAAERFAWVERIRQALATDAFELVAQPIFDVASGSISQYELLIRMVDSDGTLIPPKAFLPTAERHGLIRDIDRWVIERSVAIAGEALRDSSTPLRLEVNLSGRSVGDPELPAFIADQIAAARAEPSQIVFEVTETAAIDSLHAAQDFAQSLRDLGCMFALDDFGSGFSSFVYLKHLPIDYVKIDGDFIRGLAHSASDQLFVQAIVGIARGLGKRTIAEFVEDRRTAELCRDLEVDYLQGFHIGRPVPVAEALGLATPLLSS